MKTKYYEVELWKTFEGDRITDYSLCIQGLRKPTPEEAENLLKGDIKACGYEGVTRVNEITEEEAYTDFNMEHIINPLVFGLNGYSEEKRIIDKAVTLTKELINLLDGELRVKNLELSQVFDDNISDLVALEDILYETENNLYNPPKKVEYAIIGYCKEFALYGELYYSTDIQDILKKAESIKPLCEMKTLKNAYGDPYDCIEVVQRNNHDVVYWRSYEETN